MNQKERFDLVVSLGETLLSNGGEISRTNELRYLAAEQFGLEQFNAFTIANGVFVSALVDGQQCACQVRHVPLTSIHLGRVEALNELSRHISAGEVTPEQARDAVAHIRAIRGARPQAQILAAAVGSCFFCLIFGGGWLDCAAAFCTGILLCVFSVFVCSRWSAPKVMTYLISAAFATLVCCISWHFGFGSQLDKIIIGTIFQLVPGVPFTNAVRNFMENDYIAGLVRLTDAVLIAGGIAAGVGCVLLMWNAAFGGILL